VSNRRIFLKKLGTAGAYRGLLGMSHATGNISVPVAGISGTDHLGEGKNILEPVLMQAVNSNGSQNCRIWSPRKELQPVCRIYAGQDNSPNLSIETNNNSGCHGGWEIECTNITPGKSYCFQAKATLTGIPHPVENISPEVYFFSDSESRHLDWRFIEAVSQDNSEVVFNHIFDVPPETDRMVIRLILRWTAYGSVKFNDISLTELQKLQSNTSIIAVGSGWKPMRSVQENMNKCIGVIKKAAQKGADLILLPEVILTVGVPESSGPLARMIPGNETDQIADCARSNNIAVALTMVEANGTLTHNTGLIFNKNGDIVLKYRKVHLAVGERWSGMTPGNDYPCADLPLGKTGMQICYDNVHPEGARILARQGARIILLPIMGDPRAHVMTDKGKWKWDQEIWNKIMSMRALDNHAWYVIARNDGTGSCIINPAGEIVASKNDDEEILLAKIDSSYENLNSSIGSTHYNRYWRERRPSTYSKLDNTTFMLEPFDL